jgi:hypothetical protein
MFRKQVVEKNETHILYFYSFTLEQSHYRIKQERHVAKFFFRGSDIDFNKIRTLLRKGCFILYFET